MKRSTILYFFFVSLSVNISGQTITFNYDFSGNRTSKNIIGNRPSLSFIGDSIICNGESTLLTVNGGNTYQWNTGSTNSSINITPQLTTTYSVVGTGSTPGCTSQSSIIVTVNSIPITSAITGNNISQSNAIENYSLINTVGSQYMWIVNNGTITSGSGTSQVSINWTTIGIDTIKVVETNQYGCIGDTVRLGIDILTGLNELHGSSVQMKVFPNPSSGSFVIQVNVNKTERIKLALYNYLGECVSVFQDDEVSPGKYEYLNNYKNNYSAELNSGIYYVRLTNDHENLINKITIVK